jgi:heme exporter protein D
MAPIWRWILAMGGSAFVMVAGIVVVLRGGADYGQFGWLILAIGAVSLLVNLVMRKQFL